MGLTRRAALAAIITTGAGGFLVGDTASAIAAAGQSGARMRIGTVTAYNPAAGTLTVTVGGTAQSGVYYTSGYLPAVGDIVAVLNDGPTWFVLGSTTNTLSRLTPVTATIATFEQQANTASFGNLTTVGPAVTVTIGGPGKALVLMSVQIQPGPLSFGDVSVAISGASTVAADDDHMMTAYTESTTSYNYESTSKTLLYEGLNPGSTTFTLKYRSEVHDGSFPTGYLDRVITVFPY